MAGHHVTRQFVVRGPRPGSGCRTAATRLDAADRSVRADRGDDAFTDFYERTVAQVFGLMKAMLGENPVAEAVTERAYCEVWRPGGEDTAGAEELRVRLLMTAHRRASEYLRTRRSPETPVSSAPLPIPTCADGLEPSARRLVELVYYHGYTCHQAANMLGFSPRAAYQELRAALFEMSKALGAGRGAASGAEAEA